MGELIDPADPEYEWKVAEQYQALVDAPGPDDDAPVQITSRQALKLAAIAEAVAAGHVGFTDALRAGAWFLQCANAEAPHVGDRMRMSMSAAEAWERVDAYPWPRGGKPRD